MDLQSRVEQLERQVRRLRLAALVLLASACGIFLLAGPSNQAQSQPAAPAEKKAPAPAEPKQPAEGDDPTTPSFSSRSAEFEVADEGGKIQGVFIVIGSGNVFNLGGPNGYSLSQVGGNAAAPVSSGSGNKEGPAAEAGKPKVAARGNGRAARVLPLTGASFTGLLVSPGSPSPLLATTQLFRLRGPAGAAKP